MSDETEPAPTGDETTTGAPTADQEPTTPAPDPGAATETTDRHHTTVEPADQQP